MHKRHRTPRRLQTFRDGSDVRLRRIPLLRRGGWRLCSIEEVFIRGAVPKNYLLFGDLEDPSALGYIAKQPRVYGPRECVTEHLISCVGKLLPLKMAKSKLVRLEMPTGAPELRYLSRNFLRTGRSGLKHGVELVADYIGSTQGELQEVFNLGDPAAERKFYTLEAVVCVLGAWGRDEREKQSLLDSFGRMLALDALVGAPDRHAENWGVIEHPGNPSAPRRFAPIYDTARGLFADHKDAKFAAVQAQGRRHQHIERYAMRSRPVFSCANGPAQVNHFDLIRYAVTHFRDELRSSISQVIRAYDHWETSKLLAREFKGVISPLRMGYVLDLLHFRHAALLKLL
jgi:hypothetical protein